MHGHRNVKFVISQSAYVGRYIDCIICRKFPEDDSLGAETCKSFTGERRFMNCILLIEFVS